jgi:predicted O-methyltransferase YrrM
MNAMKLTAQREFLLPKIDWRQVATEEELKIHLQTILGGWNEREDILFHEAIYGKGQGYVLEIGSSYGLSLCILAAGSKFANREIAFSVDIDVGYGQNPLIQGHRQNNGYTRWGYLLDNLCYCGVHDWVVLIASDSLKAHEWLNIPLRLLFLDGCHTRQYVLHEINTYGKLLVPGGKIVLHDYYISRQDEYSQAAYERLAESDDFTDFVEYDKLLYHDSITCAATKR